MNADKIAAVGWIENTGSCPVESDTLVDVEISDYTFQEVKLGSPALRWNWHIEGFADVKRWRLHKPIEAASADAPNAAEKIVEKFHSLSEKVVGISDNIGSDTNPKKQFGDKSIPLGLWPALASSYGSLGLYNGSLKYGRGNYKFTQVEASIYISAALRHLSAWAEGEEFDPADGVPNLGGVLANIAILLEARAAGTLIDDRNIGTGYLQEREALKEIVKNLQEVHKDKSPKHYTLKDTA